MVKVSNRATVNHIVQDFRGVSNKSPGPAHYLSNAALHCCPVTRPIISPLVVQSPTSDDYKAWIDGFPAGLGDQKVVVILEPDGLALLPTDCGQPDTYDRMSLIYYAAHARPRGPSAAIYLDAGHRAWHSVGDMAVPTAHFVVDTSRNGQDPWIPPANTGQPRLDAYLWVKIPGESDGQCYRWTSGPFDPVPGIQDPLAGPMGKDN